MEDVMGGGRRGCSEGPQSSTDAGSMDLQPGAPETQLGSEARGGRGREEGGWEGKGKRTIVISASRTRQAAESVQMDWW